jgi:glycosyltransferase involved in cell wall biosynthesis
MLVGSTMKVLFVAPLPPPTNGQALAAKVFLDDLMKTHEVEVVNLAVGSRGDGAVTTKRIFEVVKVLVEVVRQKGSVDVIYFTISESIAGNIKDLLIYCICSANLAKMYVHLHGGTIKAELFDRYRLLKHLNTRFISKLAGVIISGESHRNIFADMISSTRIHVSANFALDHLFVTESTVIEKFSDTQPLRILYLSNMVQMKGYDDLADAYMSLSSAVRKRIRVDFAGRFEYESEREKFLSKIAEVDGIHYHGMANEEEKQLFFSKAHVFCLPTAFLEGQPVSILEAYASGCVVLTTGQSGIRDIFTSGVNGFEVKEKSAESIASALELLSSDPSGLEKIAITNRQLAGELYRTSSYNLRLRKILERSNRSYETAK